MDSKNLNRSHLETLSSADLISLADSFGLDIPDNLNRSFIISELLEVQEELNDSVEDDILTSEEVIVKEENVKLAESYNETVICAILRNPAWIFVYWDIKASDISRLLSDSSFKSLCLRVSFWENPEDLNPIESFDIQISTSDRRQYVLLSQGKRFVRIDLIALFTGKEDEILSISKKMELPKASSILNSALPGREMNFSEILKLSGLPSLLKTHFENHRQSF